MATIAAEISALRQRISEAYDVIDQKGGDVPFDRTSWNLSASIDSIRTGGGEAEDVNGISSLYAVQPELGSNGTFTGTLRNGPYHVDWSNLTQVNAYNRMPAGMFGRYGVWSYADLETQLPATIEAWKNCTPNISSLDIHNLTLVPQQYGMAALFLGNLNILSVGMPDTITTLANYSFANFARATTLPCDFTGLTGITRTPQYVFQNAWYDVQANYNPLSDVEERYFPNLKTIQGSNQNYSFQNTLCKYRPHHNYRVEFTELTNLVGERVFDNFMSYSKIREVSFPKLKTIPNTGNSIYVFQQAFANSDVSAVEFPELSGIYFSYDFQNAFYSCRSLSSIEFPKLKTIGSSGNTGSYTFYLAWGNCPRLTSVSFPELTGVQTGAIQVFTNCMHSDSNIGQLTAFDMCHFYFPKLVSWRWNAANGTFFRMNDQTTAIYIRRYAVHIGAEAADITPNVGTTAANAMFYNSRGLSEVYLHNFASITGTAMFNSCNELTAIHFAAEHEDAIKASNGWSTLWGRGAGAATVYFDL